MNPDCSISWSLYNDSRFQWIDTDPGAGTAEYSLRCAKCSDFMYRSLRAFGAKMKCPDGRRKLARVTLAIYDDEFEIKVSRYEPLIGGENDMVLAVAALFTGWAHEAHLNPMPLDKDKGGCVI